MPDLRIYLIVSLYVFCIIVSSDIHLSGDAVILHMQENKHTAGAIMLSEFASTTP